MSTLKSPEGSEAAQESYEWLWDKVQNMWVKITARIVKDEDVVVVDVPALVNAQTVYISVARRRLWALLKSRHLALILLRVNCRHLSGFYSVIT